MNIICRYAIILSLVFFWACSSTPIEYGDKYLSQRINISDAKSLKRKPEQFNLDTIRTVGKLDLDLENKALVQGSNLIWIHSFKPATSTNKA